MRFLARPLAEADFIKSPSRPSKEEVIRPPEHPVSAILPSARRSFPPDLGWTTFLFSIATPSSDLVWGPCLHPHVADPYTITSVAVPPLAPLGGARTAPNIKLPPVRVSQGCTGSASFSEAQRPSSIPDSPKILWRVPWLARVVSTQVPPSVVKERVRGSLDISAWSVRPRLS